MKVLLNEIYSHEELLEKGYGVSDIKINETSDKYEASLFKGKDLVGRIRNVGNSSWVVFELEKTGQMIPGELYEGSAEKTVIFQCIESIGDFHKEDLLNKNPQIISRLVNDLWLRDDIWEEFDLKIAEEVQKFKEENPDF